MTGDAGAAATSPQALCGAPSCGDGADPAAQVAAATAGSVRDIARLVTHAENGGGPGAALARALVGLPRRAHIIGITGAPGAGKSTLTNALLRELRTPAHRRSATGEAVAVEARDAPQIAVLAIDPSSPFTGGALLGDRVRMAEWSTEPGVYIRSLSSRGNLGGLSAGTPAAVDLMSALGFDIVIVETVGVGQSEVDIMNLADTVVVVLAPGMGDAVQAAKAGIMEIADVLVINKADHEGARTAVREVKAMLALGRSQSRGSAVGPARVAAGAAGDAWAIPVLATIADNGTGVDDLAAALATHRARLHDSGEITERRERRGMAAVQAVVVEQVRRALFGPAGRESVRNAASAVIHGDSDLYRAADAIVDAIPSLRF